MSARPNSPATRILHSVVSATTSSTTMGGVTESPASGSSSVSLGSNSGSNSNSNSNSINNANGGEQAMSSFKMLLLVMMVFQNSFTVLVGRYTRAGVAESELFDVNHLILVVETCKLIISAGLEFYTTQGKLWLSIETHILQRPADALKILVPALLYLVQNTLLYVALSNLTAPIFQVTYQAKLVTTALVSVFMLQRSYSMQQWICLFLLSMGVAVVVLGETKTKAVAAATRSLLSGDSAPAAQNLVLGLTAVSIACFSSALAGVYFEKVLKKPSVDATKQAPASLWMRNIQLSFFSIVIAAIQGLFKEAPAVPQSYFHGFSVWAWILIFLQAGGGLLVAAVIKYADNVLKGLATGVSVVFATALSMIFFGTPLTGQFSVGAALILAAVYFFSNPLPVAFVGDSGKKTEDSVETKKLLPK